MPFARAACRENAQPGKFPIPSQSFATHDQCLYNRLAYTRQFGERPPEFSRGHVEYLRLFRCYPRCRKDRRPLEHRDVTEEIALVRGAKNLDDVIALLKRFEFAAQNNGQADIALPRFKE